jgi:hypothetical protein
MEEEISCFIIVKPQLFGALLFIVEQIDNYIVYIIKVMSKITTPPKLLT